MSRESSIMQLFNSMFSDIEKQQIEKDKTGNDRLEEIFAQEREAWRERSDQVFAPLKEGFNNLDKDSILEAQAYALTYKQQLNDRITGYLAKRASVTSAHTKLEQQKYVFYAVGFDIKTNSGDKKILMDGHLVELDRRLALYATQVDFLRETMNNFNSFLYSVKNIIDLMNLLK